MIAGKEKVISRAVAQKENPRLFVFPVKGTNMLRINEFQFYELAVAIHPCAEVEAKAKYSEVLFVWMGAKTALQNLFKQRSLEFCFEAANDLYLKLGQIIPDDFDEAIAKMPDTSPGAPEEPALGYQVFAVKTAAQKFETVLAAELSNSDTYWISPKGTHKTSVLMQTARQELPASLLTIVPEEALKELDEAGRCLLFDNATAAGFHLFRATETVIREYYRMIVGSVPAKKSRNWGSYIHGLKTKDASAKVTGYLDHIREQYRNPVLHPEVTLNSEEAQILFGVCISAMSMMAMELRAKPSATLPFPVTGAIAATGTTT